MQDEVAAAVPESRATTSWGTPSVDIGAGIRAQLADEGVACVDLSVCTRESPGPLLLPPRPADLRPPGRRDPDGAAHDASAATSSPPTWTPYAAASRPPRRPRAATRRRSPSSPSPSSSRPPTSACWPTSASPTSGRTATRRPRRRPPRARTWTCAGTSSAGCRATRPPPSRRTPTSSSPSTAPSWSSRSTAGRTSRSHDVDVLLQVSLDPPGREGRAGADPAELDALAAAVEEAGMLRLRGLMAVAPLGEDPGAGVRPAGRDPPRPARRAAPTPPGSRRG